MFAILSHQQFFLFQKIHLFSIMILKPNSFFVFLLLSFISCQPVWAEVVKMETSSNAAFITESEKFFSEGNIEQAKATAEKGVQAAGSSTETARAQLQLLKVYTSNTKLKKADRAKINTLYFEAIQNAAADPALQQKLIEVIVAYCERDNLKEPLASALRTKMEIEVRQVKEKERTKETQLNQLQQQLTSLLDTNQVLGSQIAEQRTKIYGMNAAQAKGALETALQKQLLDSMAMVSLIDSMRIQEQNQIMQAQADSLGKQQTALQLQQSQRNVFMIVAASILFIALGLMFVLFQMRKHNTVLNEKNQIIQKEKKHNEELLLNILPKAISDELKEHGAVRAKRYDSVSVLFSDFVNFSQISETLSPEDLVRELDYCFKQFDKIVTKNGLEKIKTIGDAYMCAGGLPEDNDLHAEHAVNTAIEMQQFLADWNADRRKNNLPEYHARIGINTGALVAGVVGIKKFAYDIWGDTVNVASRMESSCDPDKINISGETYARIREKFHCIYRGKLPIKNKGEVDMYFVSAGKA